jgi:hypothetical protein
MHNLRGTFTDPDGQNPHLRGQTALLMCSRDGTVTAQFNDVGLAEAFGWWRYPEGHFVIEPPIRWDEPEVTVGPASPPVGWE